MQVLEFVAFAERLASSHTRAAARAESALSAARSIACCLPTSPINPSSPQAPAVSAARSSVIVSGSTGDSGGTTEHWEAPMAAVEALSMSLRAACETYVPAADLPTSSR